MDQTENHAGEVPAKRKGFGSGLLNVALFVAVFIFGVGVGQGNIDFGINDSFTTTNKQLPAKLNYAAVDEVYQSLKDNYNGKLTETQLIEGMKHGLAASTKDPYTVYFTAEEAKEFEAQLNNSFSGIGAQLGQDKDGNIEVIAPIEGLPAEKAGLKAKDIIAEINGVSTSGMSVEDAVSKIRGRKGTTVKLQIVRDRKEALTFAIERDNITLPSVETDILEGNVGHLQINSFANDTTKLAREAAKDFKDKNVKAIILDLRNNPGGLLDSSVEVASLWLPAGQTILEEKRGNKVVESYKSLGGDIFNGIPTVVLINEGSASASEITAGALKDNKAAYLIGDKSYGKGVVQQLINFKDGSQLKVTIASWYRPNGQSIDKRGITPDKLVKISDDDAKNEIDTQLKAAEAYLKK